MRQLNDCVAAYRSPLSCGLFNGISDVTRSELATVPVSQWQTYHTLGGIPMFGADSRESAAPEAGGACCAPVTSIPAVIEKKVGCC